MAVRAAGLFGARRLSKLYDMNKRDKAGWAALIIMLLAVAGTLYYGQGLNAGKAPAPVTDTVTVERTVTVTEVDASMATALDNANERIINLRRKLAALQAAQEEGSGSEFPNNHDTLPDSVDGDDCAGQLLALQRRLSRQAQALETANLLISALNDELRPKQDTGRHVTPSYEFAYQITHSGRLAPGGFRYQLRLTPSAHATHRPNSASLLAGVAADGVPVYGVQYGLVGEKMLGVVQVQYPLGLLGGVGVRW